MLAVFLFCSFSQVDAFDEERLEDILERISMDTGTSPKLEQIEIFLEKSLNLKAANLETFLKIPGFSRLEAKEIIETARLDSVRSVQDLIREVDLSKEQEYLLKSFCVVVKIEEKREQRPKEILWRTRNKNYISKIRGFEENIFQGSSLDLYQRLLAFYGENSIGVLMDKDAGEKSIADFYSAYLDLNLGGYRVLMGDYSLELGLGNLFWKPFSLRKGANVIYGALRIGSGVSPYKSSIDGSFFRGGAVETSYSIGDSSELDLTVWASRANRAANIDSSGALATSVYNAGYFRTETEIEKAGSLKENCYGVDIKLDKDNLTVGALLSGLHYDKKIVSESKSAFSGKSGFITSLYGALTYEDQAYGVEITREAKGNLGVKAGAQMKFDKFNLAFALRSFSLKYRAPYGFNFGESSSPANELGVYSAIDWDVCKNVRFKSYLDLYATYGKTYYVPEQVKGIDFFAQTRCRFNDKTDFIFRTQFENKTDAKTLATDEKQVFQKGKFRLRTEIVRQALETLRFRVRAECAYLNFQEVVPDELGLATFFDTRWRPCDFVELGSRFSFFSTPSFESAIWQFEYAAPGYMTTRPLYGEGERFYVYVKFVLWDKIALRLRYSALMKNSVDGIGSSYLETLSNSDERYLIQVDASI